MTFAFRCEYHFYELSKKKHISADGGTMVLKFKSKRARKSIYHFQIIVKGYCCYGTKTIRGDNSVTSWGGAKQILLF